MSLRFTYDLIDYYNNKKEQLLLIVNGEGGTGKSYLIFAISQLLDEALIRTAPTAKASFLIYGDTVHSKFYIDCHSSAENKRNMIPLSKNCLKQLQADIKGKAVIK